MTTPRIRYARRDDHVLVITLARADKKNAFDLQMLQELCDAYGELDRNPELRAGVVHAGRAVSDTGFEASLSTTMEPRRGDGPTITLDLETGIGDVWVYRMAPTRQQLRELEKEQT